MLIQIQRVGICGTDRELIHCSFGAPPPGWRDRVLASPRFQAWAAAMPLTRPIARKRARALFDLCAGFVYSQVLVACVRRELHEETSLSLPPTAPLRFIFRAITPQGSPRRFDARFFLADANHIDGALDDFSGAEDELSHLHWVALDETRTLDLPFITEIVLAELRALLAGHDQQGVPFFDNSGPVPTFRRIT